MNAMDTMVESNSVILYAGGAFLLAFVCSVLGRFNALEQRVSPVTKNTTSSPYNVLVRAPRLSFKKNKYLEALLLLFQGKF